MTNKANRATALGGPDAQVIRGFRMAGKKMSVRELSEVTGMNANLARATVRALVGAGYLERRGGRFRLTEGGKLVDLK